MSGEAPNIKKMTKAAENSYDAQNSVEEVRGGTVFLSEWDADTNKNRLRATAVVNSESKEITYAIAGTRISAGEQGRKEARADLLDDMRLLSGSLPKKVEGIKALNSQIIEYIKQDAASKQEDCTKALSEYKFNFSGHSLGAALSDCAATNMYFQLKKEGIEPQNMQISSTSFDNPGAKTAVQNMIKQHNKDNPGPKVKLEDLRDNISFKAFNNSKNFINTMDQQVCQKYRIMKEGGKEPNAFQRMCAFIATKCLKGSVLSKVFHFLSFGRLTNQAKGHSMQNFVDVLVDGGGKVKHKGVIMSVDDITEDREPIKYDSKVFQSLKKDLGKIRIIENGAKEQEFVMVDPKNPDIKVVATEAHIKKAYEDLHPTKKKENQQGVIPQKKTFASRFARKKTQLSLLTAKDVASGIMPGRSRSASHGRESVV